MEAPNTGTMPPPSPPPSKNFVCLLTLNLSCYQLEKSFKLLVAKASVGSLEIYTTGMLRECRTRRCTRVVGHGQLSSQQCHVLVPRSTRISSHGAESAMLIIVDADAVNALVGKEKKMRVKAFFGAD